MYYDKLKEQEDSILERGKRRIVVETLSNMKLNFEREDDKLLLTMQSGNYVVKIDVTDVVLPLVDKIHFYNNDITSYRE